MQDGFVIWDILGQDCVTFRIRVLSKCEDGGGGEPLAVVGSVC